MSEIKRMFERSVHKKLFWVMERHEKEHHEKEHQMVESGMFVIKIGEDVKYRTKGAFVKRSAMP